MKKLEWINRKNIVTTFLPVTIFLIAACGGGAAATIAPSETATQTPVDLPKVTEVLAATETPVEPESIQISTDTTELVEVMPEPQVVASVDNAIETDQVEQPEVHAADIDDLSDDEIVAAYERVSIGLYDDVLPSVVQISVAQETSDSNLPFGINPNDPDIPDFLRSGEGSGFVWSDEGFIVTNRHVIADADLVLVRFADGTQAEAEVIGSDSDSDLAVLKVDLPASKLPPVKLGSSEDAKVGQFAAAIGNPFGQEFTLTTGIISAVGRTINSGNSQFSIPEVIQTDAAINPGNSGGPLLDRNGEVIGINTQIISRSGANSGVGFAVPIDVAKRVVPSIIEKGFFEYSWLGISGASLVPDVANAMGLPDSTRGAIVIEVAEDGPASDAGLRGSDRTQRINGGNTPVGGDVIIAIDGTPIMEMDDLISYLVVNTRPGDVVTFDVVRDGGEKAEIDVTLGARPR